MLNLVAKRVAKSLEPPLYEPLSSDAVADFSAAIKTAEHSAIYGMWCLIFCVFAGLIEIGATMVMGANFQALCFFVGAVGICTFYGIYWTQKRYLIAVERSTSRLIDVYEQYLGHTDEAKRFLRDIRKDPYGAAKSGITVAVFTGQWWMAIVGPTATLFGLAKKKAKDVRKPGMQRKVETQIGRGVHVLINRSGAEWTWTAMLLIAMGTIALAADWGYNAYLDANTAKAHSSESSSGLSVEEWKKKAIEQYPELAFAGSPFNAVFVAKYKAYEGSNYFDSPDWPIRLAKECAETIPATIQSSLAAKLVNTTCVKGG